MADIKMKNAFAAMNQIWGDVPYTAEDRYYEMLDNISIAVVDYRVSHHLSQKQLADQLGISQAMVSKYESGDYNISLKALIDLFDKLSIPLDIHFGDSAQNQSVSSASETLRPKYRKMQNDTTVSETTDQTPGAAA